MSYGIRLSFLTFYNSGAVRAIKVIQSIAICFKETDIRSIDL